MKRFLILFFSLMLPFAAQASIVSDTIPEGNGRLATVRYVFEGEAPPAAAKVLLAFGYEEADCVYGLAQERLVLETPEGQEGLSRASDALMVMARGEGRALVGIRWNDVTGERWLADYGAMGLDLSRFSLVFRQDGMPTLVDYVLTAACEGQEQEFRLNVTDQNLWYIKQSGEVVWNEASACFEFADGSWPACWTGCLEYLTSFADFPQTAQEAKALAADSWAGMDLTNLAWLGGNLRTQPTAQSESLGNCYNGVLGEVLGERMGWNAPWYQVRVGDTVGWMSSPYVTLVTDWASMAEKRHYGLPVARAKEALLLRQADGGTLALPAGTLMQVLSRTEDGWLHVCLPSGAMMRWMDVNGTFGYLHESGVDAADSVKALP